MKLITSRPPPPTSEFETVKQQALDSRYASARLIALASAHNSRLEHSASAPLIKATKDHYILFLIDGDAYHVSIHNQHPIKNADLFLLSLPISSPTKASTAGEHGMPSDLPYPYSASSGTGVRPVGMA
jgi:hypothetical protein